MSANSAGVTPCGSAALASGSEAMHAALAAAQEIIDGVKADTRPLPSPEEVCEMENRFNHAYVLFYDEVTDTDGGAAALDAMDKEMNIVLDSLWAGRKEAYWEEQDYAAEAAKDRQRREAEALFSKTRAAESRVRSATQHSGDREDTREKGRNRRPGRSNARRQALRESMG